MESYFLVQELLGIIRIIRFLILKMSIIRRAFSVLEALYKT